MATRIIVQSRAATLKAALLCLSIFTGCATTEPSADVHATAGKNTSKTAPGSKKPKAGGEVGTDGKTISIVPAKPTQPMPPTGDELASFVVRAGVSSGPFTEQDRQMLALIATSSTTAATATTAPAPGSIQEAAIALGVIRTVYNPATAQPTKFVESDLGNGLTANRATDQAAATRSDLEVEASNKSINIASALEQNTFLQTENIFQMTLAALAVGGTAGDAYSERIKGVMSQRVRSWIKFGEMNSLLPKEVPQTPTPLVSDQAPVPNAAEQNPSIPAATTGDVKDAEGLLAEAQALSDRGDFDAAIAQVARVSPESPQYAASLEKLKQFSNKAVHSLRTKAAQAYTSAAPVNDAKTRTTYLERARTYLQEALSKYPAADQLATVRDNLAVITRDLSKLTQDGSNQ